MWDEPVPVFGPAIKHDSAFGKSAAALDADGEVRPGRVGPGASGRVPGPGATNSKRKSAAMRVAALQQFLRSLVPALEAGEARAAARWVDEAAGALAPFGPLGLAEFAAFLARADEYQRTGAVRVPGAADQRAAGLLAALARLDAGDGDPRRPGRGGPGRGRPGPRGRAQGDGDARPEMGRRPRRRPAPVPHLQAVPSWPAGSSSPDAYTTRRYGRRSPG